MFQTGQAPTRLGGLECGSSSYRLPISVHTAKWATPKSERRLLLLPHSKMFSETVVVEPSKSLPKRDGVRGAAVLERHRPEGAGIICATDIGRRGVAAGGVRIRRSAMDPLTPKTSRTWCPLLAPAGEGAGCDPPSPPRGRGPRNSEIERRAISTFRMWFRRSGPITAHLQKHS
jgi:hypothetical protein